MSVLLLGIYNDSHQAARAAAALRAGDFKDLAAYSPIPNHALEQAVAGHGVSPVRFFVLTGAVLGCLIGFGFPIYTVLAWPLITGGMPLISIPPFVVIAFALTILFGILSGFVGFLILSRAPRWRQSALYDPRFTVDRYGVQVRCSRNQSAAAESILMAHGAEEVRHEA